ncbi:MAG TPA: hypothetical protein VHV10_15595, partial [Ktedonobacteraceae bacterium]|nr:hypothetical protein [Ktedonobacteraceae bacterium]
PNMAANIVSDQDSTPVVARSQTPGPVLYRSPQPRRYFSASRISRRRASSTSALTFNDFNRRALFDEAVRRAHQTPPLDEIPGLEDSLPNSSLVVPEYTVEASAPSLSSSACSTPSAAAFGLYQSSEAITLPSTLPATTFASSAPVFDFRYVCRLDDLLLFSDPLTVHRLVTTCRVNTAINILHILLDILVVRKS